MSRSLFTPQPWEVRSIEPDPDQARAERTGRLIHAAPKLYALAQQYLEECGECAGTGVCPDDEPCAECLFIRVIVAANLLRDALVNLALVTQ